MAAQPNFDVASSTWHDLSAFLVELHRQNPGDNAKILKWAIELDPENAAAWNSLGCQELAAGRFESAARLYLKAAMFDPLHLAYWTNAAAAYLKLNDVRAIQCIQRALAEDREFVPAYVQLAAAYEQTERDDEVLEAIEAGLAVDPTVDDLYFARAVIRLRRRDYVGGWADMERRASRLDLLPAMDEYPEWRGESLEGRTILVVREWGFGDQIMMARYLRALYELGAKQVIVYTYPELARLIALSDSRLHVVSFDRDIPDKDVDCWIGSMSLPYRLSPEGVVIGLLGVDYLRPDIADVSRLKHLAPPRGRLRVGLCWQGNKTQPRDSFRSMPFEMLAPLLDTPGCDFYSLQYADTTSLLPHLLDYTHDMAGTAALMQHLDLVITVDTSIAHLAGATGRPVWVLLSRPIEFRWASEWYKSARLIHQNEQGNWQDVIARVAADLRSLAASKPVTAACPVSEPPFIRFGKCRYGRMKWPSEDHYIGRSLALYGEYSQGEVDLFQRVLKPGDVVVEAGANIGALTLPLAHIVGAQGVVHAFEPGADYVDLLRHNAAGNPVIRAHHMGLGASSGMMKVPVVPRDGRIHSPTWNYHEQPGETAVQVTIDSLDLERVDFIKIDVDGAELDILKGAVETLKRCRPLLYVEFDKPEMYRDLPVWLEAHGYRIFRHDTRLFNPNNFHGNRTNVFGGTGSRMLLCVPSDRYDMHPMDWGLERLRVRKSA